MQDRNIMKGIGVILWTRCQRKAVDSDWFHVSSSTFHRRFQICSRREYLTSYSNPCSGTMPENAELDGSGSRSTAKWCQRLWAVVKQAKIHILVDERGAPLAIHIAVKRPHSEQHYCAGKGYDSPDIHEFVHEQRYVPHIKYRRRRNEPKTEECPIPGNKS